MTRLEYNGSCVLLTPHWRPIFATFLNYRVLTNHDNKHGADCRTTWTVEHEGRRSALSCRPASVSSSTQPLGSPITATTMAAALAARMVEIGFPDGDLHSYRARRHQCRQYYVGEKGELFDPTKLVSRPVPGKPVVCHYTGSLGPVSKLSRYYDMPQINHNDHDQIIYQDIQAMEQWLRGDGEMRLDWAYQFFSDEAEAVHRGQVGSGADAANPRQRA